MTSGLFMNRGIMTDGLDRHITGNYGEDQFRHIGTRKRKKLSKIEKDRVKLGKIEKQSTVPKKGKVKNESMD